ncbi:hypothetical protein [Vulcanisaeta distributa]|uniref:Uncharacterized protein n=1 Tax=Vulcanisaeta distributa (strain DSM 14429 / JCM 11212 / NBRC 100878 / IC-017) TaxID=572478 RepID=E1QR62_VULDI|nr:hypothetical protein [Vulcanisaeta distributa]ADN51752.1 hypothetical protein Vdis_2385 [Vulcanisaeta distributa DSM 14429]
MALADSLIFPDLLASITLVIVILILTIYLTNLLLRLSIIDYKASIGTYLFIECQLGNFTGSINLNHVVITDEVTTKNYLIICPRIAINNSRLEVNVYVAYAR